MVSGLSSKIKVGAPVLSAIAAMAVAVVTCYRCIDDETQEIQHPDPKVVPTKEVPTAPKDHYHPLQSEPSIATKSVFFDIGAMYSASGYMGDGESGNNVELNEAWKDTFHTEPSAIRIRYRPGSVGWAGVFWLNQPDNWGAKAGDDLEEKGFNKISFWAKGDSGGELVEFKAGGIENENFPHKDSFRATTGKVELSKEWEEHTIDLTGKDLSSVIGGFCWVASRSGNPNGATFYLDDIRYVGVVPCEAIKVPAKPDWKRSPLVPTGITISKGQTLTMEADGKWTVGLGQVDANGTSDACECPVRDANNRAQVGALIGQIGENGRPFLVGTSYSEKAVADGELFLGSNDNMGDCTGAGKGSCYDDNAGELGVCVLLE